MKLVIEKDKQAVKCFNFKSEDEKILLEKMSYKAKGIKEMGSVKSIETSLDFELEGSSEVRYKLTFNNGKSFSKEMNLIKINNTWYMYKF